MQTRLCKYLVAVISVMSFLAIRPHESAGSILVWSTGNENARTASFAASLMTSGGFSSVLGIDQDVPMTFAQLSTYDAVLYFSNSSNFQNPTAIGDVLAEYADTGKRLVITTFAWANQGNNTLGGRIITDALSPFVLDGSSLYSNVTMASNDGSSYFTGVNTLSGYFHDNVTLSSGAVLRGSWSDGEPLLATKGNVVGVNLFPDYSWGQIGGDHLRLFSNALAAGTATVPEPGSLIVFVGLSAIGLAVSTSRRPRKSQR